MGIAVGAAYPSLRWRAPVHAERQRRGAVVAVLRWTGGLLLPRPRGRRRRRRHRRRPRGTAAVVVGSGADESAEAGVAPTIPSFPLTRRDEEARGEEGAEPETDAVADGRGRSLPRSRLTVNARQGTRQPARPLHGLVPPPPCGVGGGGAGPAGWTGAVRFGSRLVGSGSLGPRFLSN